MGGSPLRLRPDLQDYGARQAPLGRLLQASLCWLRSKCCRSLCFLIRVASTLSTRVGASKGSQHRRRAAGLTG